MGETCPALLKELWKCRGFDREPLCLGTLLEGVEGLEMPAWMLHNSWPAERKIFCSTRSPSNNYPGAWRGHAWESGLQWRTLCPLSRHLCRRCLRTTMEVHPCTVCVCVWYACKHIWYVCMEDAIYDICGIFKFLHTYIYTQPYLFFSIGSDGNVFEKWIISAASFSLNSNSGAWQWEGSCYFKKSLFP